ncbi:hypothetical protein PAP18089_01611 [Pandoraea apista]|uniref:Uncharacterized protein n=2 Tax=Pandoraea apista TaxID=93218 RepID=A0A5E5P2K1_9BURK|nr:hypothetical protein B7H01_20125 [Pandoraea apista]VVG70647.1 hypothetical protein PAP18089_01611 [Pandoraea apista]
MKGATARNAHWQARTGSYSTHGSRTGANLLGWDTGTTEQMTPEQERDALVAVVKRVHEKLRDRTISKQERRTLGQQQFELNKRINAIRPAMKCKGIEPFLLDVFREKLSRAEWDAAMKEAKRRHAAQQQEIA